ALAKEQPKPNRDGPNHRQTDQLVPLSAGIILWQKPKPTSGKTRASWPRSKKAAPHLTLRSSSVRSAAVGAITIKARTFTAATASKVGTAVPKTRHLRMTGSTFISMVSCRWRTRSQLSKKEANENEQNHHRATLQY